MFHPATLLVAWTFAVVAVHALESCGALIGLAVLGAAGSSPGLLRRLIWRSRWLFVSIAVLFLWMTPGLRTSGLLGQLGVTEDGLRLAAVQLLHLLSLLVLVALLLSRMAMVEIVSGLHALFRPLYGVKGLSQRAAARLMLTLDYAGSGHIGDDNQERRSHGALEFTQPHWTAWDAVVLAALVGLATCGALMP